MMQLQKSFLLFFLWLLPYTGVCQNASIEVSIIGMKNAKGTIEIGLYEEENFLKQSTSGVSIPILDLKAKHLFKSIPEGVYAIAVWHDENNNGILDSNMLGIPKEKYGFSLNKYGMFGPPEFKKVAFKLVEGEELKLEVLLK